MTAVIVVLWAIYRPDIQRPFRVVDFSEFVPLLQRSTDWPARTGALVEYYASQGRFNVVAYVLLAAKWTLLGWSSPAWQLARAALMLLVSALAFTLLRRLGASRLGGAVGASLFLWAPAASDGWVRLTMAEPVAAALMFLVSLRAMKFQASMRWRREAALIGAAVAVLILTKELLAPLLLLPLTLALAVQPDGAFAFPRRERRNIELLLVVGAFAAAALGAVALVHLRSADTGYSSFFGLTMLAPEALLAIWVTAFIPFEALPLPPNAVWALAFFGLIVLVATGWRIGLRHPSAGRRARWLLATALLLPAMGIVVYFPNPWYARYYTLPYLIGPAILLGMAATYLEGNASKGRALVLACWAAMSVYAIGEAAALASSTDGVQRRDDAVVAFVGDSLRADSVLFATNRPPPPEWKANAASGGAPRGLGATLSRFAAATARPWPPTTDLSCEVARASMAASRKNLAVVNLGASCPLDFRPKKDVVIHFRRIDWRRLRLVTDSSHARIFMPVDGPGRP